MTRDILWKKAAGSMKIRTPPTTVISPPGHMRKTARTGDLRRLRFSVKAEMCWSCAACHLKITREEALVKIKNLPEVQEFVRLLFPKQARFEVEDWDTDWAVHVFELVVGENSVHRATLNWYRVDKQTGVVEKEL